MSHPQTFGKQELALGAHAEQLGARRADQPGIGSSCSPRRAGPAAAGRAPPPAPPPAPSDLFVGSRLRLLPPPPGVLCRLAPELGRSVSPALRDTFPAFEPTPRRERRRSGPGAPGAVGGGPVAPGAGRAWTAGPGPRERLRAA